MLTTPESDHPVRSGERVLGCRRNGDTAGFHLLEALIVCLVIALTLGMAVPLATRLSAAQKSAAACDIVVSALSKARALAVSENLPVRFLAEPGGRFALQTPGAAGPLVWRRLPEGVRFERLPRRPVTFFPHGTASPAGTYRLAHEGEALKIVVAVSGRIRWSRE